MLSTATNWILLILGFGFVIFWHELGHFLAAKQVGVRVEQFAVGFGQALLAWRKGIGFRLGSTNREYEKRLLDSAGVGPAEGSKTDAACKQLGLGETEYRLNWIPLGGYVKMLGQDDMNPNAVSDDARSFNRKSVRARMLIVSAGVLMNVLLAAVGFMTAYMIGLDTSPPVVGTVMPGSPAQRAGIEPGDRIMAFDGRPQHSFNKLSLNTALSASGVPIRVDLLRPDGTRRMVDVTPERMDESDSKEFRILGLGGPFELAGIDASAIDPKTPAELLEKLVVRPGETIVRVGGRDVEPTDLATFDRILQESGGAPVPLTLRDPAGNQRLAELTPRFAEPFGTGGISFAGLAPRTVIMGVEDASSAAGKLAAGDVVYSIGTGSDDFASRQFFPSGTEFRKAVQSAAARGQTLDVEVLRGDQKLSFTGLSPNYPISGQMVYGLGVGLGYDLDHPVTVHGKPDTLAAGVTEGFAIDAINTLPVTNWHDILRVLRTIPVGEKLILTGRLDGESKEMTLGAMDEPTRRSLDAMRYTHDLVLREQIEPRRTRNPFTAAAWGLGETRDAVMQVYLTIRRMVSGDVSVKNVSGPVGIFAHGYHFADRGMAWLLWFLAIISANLAVMNFLPIPIVDGGLFVFLILEKIMGRPVSAKVQSLAQFVGLALLLSVFLLTLYQDISRLPFMFR